MFKLDNDFLNSLGLGSLPVDEKNKLLQAIYERLEMNVGMRLAEKMTDTQLDEFEGFIDRNDEAGALRWLESNFPNYKQVVAEELEKLKSEISQSAPQILSAAQQQSNLSPQPTQPSEYPGAYPGPQQPPQHLPNQQFQPQYQQPPQPTQPSEYPGAYPGPQQPPQPQQGGTPQAPPAPYSATSFPTAPTQDDQQQQTDNSQTPPLPPSNWPQPPAGPVQP